MHDTPQQGLFNKLMRFESSGCVRVQNVRDLSSWLLQGNTRLDRASRWKPRSRPASTRRSQLAEEVPVFFTYITAWSATGWRRAVPRRHLSDAMARRTCTADALWRRAVLRLRRAGRSAAISNSRDQIICESRACLGSAACFGRPWLRFLGAADGEMTQTAQRILLSPCEEAKELATL